MHSDHAVPEPDTFSDALPQPRPYSCANGFTYADPDAFTGLLAYTDTTDSIAERNANARAIAYTEPGSGRVR